MLCDYVHCLLIFPTSLGGGGHSKCSLQRGLETHQIPVILRRGRRGTGSGWTPVSPSIWKELQNVEPRRQPHSTGTGVFVPRSLPLQKDESGTAWALPDGALETPPASHRPCSVELLRVLAMGPWLLKQLQNPDPYTFCDPSPIYCFYIWHLSWCFRTAMLEKTWESLGLPGDQSSQF